jgi:bifunctional DNase/RNase
MAQEPHYVWVHVAGVQEAGPGKYVIRLEAATGQSLPIHVGMAEGLAAYQAQTGEDPPRPMTHDLLRAVVAALGGAVELVRIDSVHEAVFHATLVLSRAGERIEVDARPSDAINLAMRVGAPIEVAEAVLRTEAAANPPELAEPAAAGGVPPESHAPVIRIVNTILIGAVDHQARRVEIRGTAHNVVVRVGEPEPMADLMSVPGYVHSPIVRRLKVMADVPPHVTGQFQQGRIPVKCHGRDYVVSAEFRPAEGEDEVVLTIEPLNSDEGPRLV